MFQICCGIGNLNAGDPVAMQVSDLAAPEPTRIALTESLGDDPVEKGPIHFRPGAASVAANTTSAEISKQPAAPSFKESRVHRTRLASTPVGANLKLHASTFRIEIMVAGLFREAVDRKETSGPPATA